jgi:protein-L-isoaspartate(D-aspartate) O-methyltransferase
MESNNQLISHLIKNGILRSDTVINAFKSIDRKDFVDSAHLQQAYEDHALPIGYGATISQPSTVAFMLEKLQAAPDNIVLDVGSGSGWTTALLASIVGNRGKVYGVELIPELVKIGQENLSKYNFPHASIEQATEELGLPQKAPFDRILVSAASPELPTQLLLQLKVGGTLIIPIQTSIWKVVKMSDVETDVTKYPGFIFVPLRS